ncbi:MAG: glucose 1-dehydrogenase [Hyphomicrobiales bacterium]|nr:glucose 1-dehydrogenase [Hyphomicrobiales bacterium]
MTFSPARLVDRRALVTGGSRGIGRAIVKRFAAEGATVAINYASHEEEARTALEAARAASRDAGYGERPHLITRADMSDLSAVDAMLKSVIDALGRLDILVNNAGIQQELAGDSPDPKGLEHVLGVNLVGAVHCSQLAIRHFLSRKGGGAIINTSSVHQIIPKPGFIGYSVSKGGLANLTRTLALEFADRGIRVNAVAPGAILTDMNDSWRNDPKKKADVERHIPMGRAGTPEEMAAVFAFLASDDASYITGQTIFACGGLTLFGDFKHNWST